MATADRKLTCVSCGREFIREGGAGRGPRRCRSCREAARTGTLHPAVCASCGREAWVAVRPRPGRPSYCADCAPKRP